MGGDALCYWLGRSGCITLECHGGCHFMQVEGFCLLSSTPEEWPKVFRERIEEMPQEEAYQALIGQGSQLAGLRGFTNDRVYMVLYKVGTISSRA